MLSGVIILNQELDIVKIITSNDLDKPMGNIDEKNKKHNHTKNYPIEEKIF